MSTVFEARHTALGSHVAIKVLRPTFDPGGADVKRILREGRAAAAVRHPNVVSVLDVGTSEEGVPYLVMELLEGEDLAKRIEREPLGVATAADLLLPIASGVAAVHRAGVVHRDLKPSNIFLARRYKGIEPVVVDFGISRTQDVATTGSSGRAIAGTVPYLAPEVLRGAEATPGADQYALGLIAYECVTGGLPFWGEDPYELLHAIMTARVVPPSEMNPRVPAAFDAVVLRAMSRDPAERFPDVRAFGAALLPFATAMPSAVWAEDLGGHTVTVSHVLVSSRPQRSAWRARLRWILPLAGAMGLGGLALARLAAPRTPAIGSVVSASPPIEVARQASRSEVTRQSPSSEATPQGSSTAAQTESTPTALAPAGGAAKAAPAVPRDVGRIGTLGIAPAAPALPREIPRSAAPPPERVAGVPHETSVPAAAPTAPSAPPVERGTGNMPILE
jgi:serine/threonine-protein kinase